MDRAGDTGLGAGGALSDPDTVPRWRDHRVLRIVAERFSAHPAPAFVEHRHAWIGDATFADAILERLLSHSYRLNLEGKSMRRQVGSRRSTSG